VNTRDPSFRASASRRSVKVSHVHVFVRFGPKRLDRRVPRGGPIRVGGQDLGRLQFTREQAVALLLAVLGSKMLDVPELESQNDMLWR